MDDRKAIYSTQRGQTTVEYILLMIVVISIVISAMTQAQVFLLGNGESCTAQSRSVICQFERAFNFGDMRYFQLRR